MAAMLETPSRIWRRIEAVEGIEMPSLPSMGGFDDSDDESGLKADSLDRVADDDFDDALEDVISGPVHSTPSVNSAASRRNPSNSSSARFALSIASRSTKSATALSASQGGPNRKASHDSFDVSRIPSLPSIRHSIGHSSDETDEDVEQSKESVPEAYLPPPDADEDDADASLADALQSVSQSFRKEPTPKKAYNASISLRSEAKLSPLEKYKNVALRKAAPAPRMRTPSLTNTNSSPTSSPTHSTPKSNLSFSTSRSHPSSPIRPSQVPLPQSNGHSPANIPLPRSRDVSPAVQSSHFSPGDHLGDELDASGYAMEDTSVLSSAHGINKPQVQYDDETEESRRLPAVSDTEDEREPTFSSEVANTPTAFSRAAKASPTVSVPYTSPIPSFTQTPTPACPRPRARFQLPPPSTNLYALPAKPSPIHEEAGDEEGDYEEEEINDEPTARMHLQETPMPQREDQLTPKTRRKSFFLSVINSAARPRVKPYTPHHRLRDLQAPGTIPETPAQASAEPPSSAPRGALQSAFAGVTPGPRARGQRLSDPLIGPIPESDTESQSGTASASGERRVAFGTLHAGLSSPYDGAVDKASFISTASSHDLTAHQRANTSFDPSMGFGLGAPGQGVGRFNAGKLNNYLHGLNRQLQRENEALLNRVTALEEEVNRVTDLEEEREVERSVRMPDGEMHGREDDEAKGTGRRSLAGRRISMGGMLEDVKEDVSLEHWMEEKVELEAMVQEFKDELAKCLTGKQTVEQELEEEKQKRSRDKDAWRDKMVDVQKGVAEIIEKLEKDKQDAEEETKRIETEHSEYVKSMERKLDEVRADMQLATSRAEKTEKILENERDLGGELREANEKMAQLNHELTLAHGQLQEMEDMIAHSEERIETLKKQKKDDDERIKTLERDLSARTNDLAEARRKIQRQEEQHMTTDTDDKEYIAALESGADLSANKIAKYEARFATSLDKVQELTALNDASSEEVERLQGDVHRAQELGRQLEVALEAADTKMEADDGLIADLKSQVNALEREKQRESSFSKESSKAPMGSGPTEEEYDALEQELDAAHKEIGRLTAILSQSPARRAMDNARDTKIEVLEREREELLERNRALRMAMNDMSTPSKALNSSTISPIHRQVLAMSIKGPRTPGAPLRELSWLNSTMADPSASPLLSEISRLQRELDKANDSIDDKLDKLEDAGQGVIELTQKLGDAKSRISSLEQEIARLSRKEERRTRRMQRLHCQKCLVKVDVGGLKADPDESSFDVSNISLPTEALTPSTRTTEMLKANVQSLNSQLDTMKSQWEAERRKLIGEKAALQDTARRLNAEIEGARAEARRVAESELAIEMTKAGVQTDLARAKRTIAELEEDLKEERERLRTLTTEQTRVQRDKTGILAQLQNTEADLEEVKRQLQRLKRENNDLESELLGNANAEKRVRVLEARVSENTDTIEQLRKERSTLSKEHKGLQRRFLEISDQANKLRDQYTERANQHEGRRNQLELHHGEIEELRNALLDKKEELQRAEDERERMAAEKDDAARTVSGLERDLRRVRAEAEAFGKDLRRLRAENEKAENKAQEELQQLDRSKRQVQTQLRLANEQLEAQKDKNACMREELKNHICKIDDQQVQALKVQHNKECKGLIVQIKYLKAKFTRESTFRSDLAYQKTYLLNLLSHYEKSERTIFAAIAQIGFPLLRAPPSPPVKKARKLKSVAWMMIFTSRARRASEEWRANTASKQAITAALQDVRQRRALKAP